MILKKKEIGQIVSNRFAAATRSNGFKPFKPQIRSLLCSTTCPHGNVVRCSNRQAVFNVFEESQIVSNRFQILEPTPLPGVTARGAKGYRI